MALNTIDVSTLTVAGTSIGLDSASPTKAAAFTAGARQALIVVENAPVYVRSDGDDATSADILLNVGDVLPMLGDNMNQVLDNLRFIRKTSTSATLKIIWYSREAVLTERIIRGTVRLVTEAGESVADDTADAIKVLPVNPAGTSYIGGILKSVSVTKVLVAATTYDAGDVLSESATNGVGTAWTFSAIARANGAKGYITKAHVISETTAITPKLVLYLFKATPTCELDDHAANTALLHADLANYIGRIDFPALSEHGTGDAEALATPSTYGNLPMEFECASDADDFYGVLVTLDDFTQDAGDDMTIVLTVEQY